MHSLGTLQVDLSILTQNQLGLVGLLTVGPGSDHPVKLAARFLYAPRTAQIDRQTVRALT